MKLEDQVCHLLQAKRLHELGIKQDSIFYHTQERTPSNPNMSLYGYSQESMPIYIMYGRQSSISGNSVYVEYSAFTVAELGELLPEKFLYQDLVCFVSSEKYCKEYKWIAGIHTVWAYKNPIVAKKYFPGDNEAQVRTALLIHLLESKSITAEEINQRLLAK